MTPRRDAYLLMFLLARHVWGPRGQVRQDVRIVRGVKSQRPRLYLRDRPAQPEGSYG